MMSKRRLFRWPAPRTVCLGCLALVFTTLVTMFLYMSEPLDIQPGMYTYLDSNLCISPYRDGVSHIPNDIMANEYQTLSP